MKGYIKYFVLVVLILGSTPAYSGIMKWIKKEAIPTIKGDRPEWH